MSDTDGGPLSITVNGEPVETVPGELVISAAERAGVYIPRFCYHPRMRSVGMCRMCIVDIDTGRGPALQPACMIEVAPDMVVDTQSEATKKAQDGVLEFLLINHPLDCPVCDKGGECPLQDQTMAYGPGESRFVEEKRHYAKPIALSELVLMDRERCILCDRCTRFADEVAGDPLISFIGRGSSTEVNTFPDHPFSSYFSGNTVQICPVGALTAEPFRFRARPWDLANAESTCTTCSVGCRVAIQSSRDDVLRYSGVDVDPVNWGWLCDKGRWDHGYVNSDDRLGEPLVRTAGGSGLTRTRWSDALGRAAAALDAAPAERIGVIGGARLTNEAAYAWAKLAKGVLGTDNVDAQLGDGLPADLVLGLPRATIDEACAPGTTVVLLGPDVKEELAVLYLRLRHAAVEDGVRLIEVTPATTGLSRYAAHTELHPPGQSAVAVEAVLAAGHLGDGPVVVVLGRPSLAEPADHVARAAAILARHPGTRFLSALRRANVHGALDMGLAPGLLPGRTTLDGGRDAFADAWATVPATAGNDTEAMLRSAADGGMDVLVLLGADPVQDAPDRDLARRALEQAGTVIAVDCFPTASTDLADVVLPAAGYAEVEGTVTNLEGRVNTVAQRVTAPGTARPDSVIAAELAGHLGTDLGVTSVEDLRAEIERVSPPHAQLGERLGAAGGNGVVVEGSSITPAEVDERTLPAADSYSLRLVTGRTMYDDATLVQRTPAIAKLARPATIRLNPHDFDALGVGDGTPVKVSSARGAVTATVSSDPGVPRDSAVLPFNAPGGGGGDLVTDGEAVTDVRGGEGLMDPLLTGDLTAGDVGIVLLKVVVAFVFLLVAVMLMIWFERKLISDMQNRIGPNIAGPWGLFQTFADGVKFFFKEDLKPIRADLGVFRLAPYLSIIPAFVVFCIVPIGGNFQGDDAGVVSIFGHDTFLQVADPPIGVLLFLALSSIAVYGVMLAGWSSGSKYPLLGSVRATAQMVSYEAALGLSVAAVILLTGSLSTHAIVDNQANSWTDWNILAAGVIPFVVFLLAGTAELNRPPFDLVEAEQEIVGGFHTEYSSIRFALFFLAEFMNVITMSAIIVTLFLGGPAGPHLFGPDLLWGPIWFFAKVMVFLFTFVWFRATLPRFRYDQLMDLGWKVLIPLGLGWLLVLAAVRIMRDEDWNPFWVFGIGAAIGGVCFGLLIRAIAAAQEQRDADTAEVFD